MHRLRCCEPECPVEAILPDTDPKATEWIEFNREYADKWPNITQIGEVPADAEKWAGVEGKMQYFSPNPGKGD